MGAGEEEMGRFELVREEQSFSGKVTPTLALSLTFLTRCKGDGREGSELRELPNGQTSRR